MVVNTGGIMEVLVAVGVVSVMLAVGFGFGMIYGKLISKEKKWEQTK